MPITLAQHSDWLCWLITEKCLERHRRTSVCSQFLPTGGSSLLQLLLDDYTTTAGKKLPTQTGHVSVREKNLLKFLPKTVLDFQSESGRGRIGEQVSSGLLMILALELALEWALEPELESALELQTGGCSEQICSFPLLDVPVHWPTY